MENLQIYDEDGGAITCPRCDHDEYVDDIPLGTSGSIRYHTFTCTKCFKKVKTGWVRFVKVPRRREALQPLCLICQKVLVEHYGDICPGCEDRERIEGRDIAKDQAGLGRFC